MGKRYGRWKNFTDFWRIIPVNQERYKRMKEEKIKRINELYHKSKAEGLTEAEKKEQKILRQEYIEAFRENLRGQLNQISIKEKDGTIINLGEKYGKKRNQKKGS